MKPHTSVFKQNQVLQISAIVLGMLLNSSAWSSDKFPKSDPSNSGGWVLNTSVSDEFDKATLDEDKWWVVGKFENGKPVYKDPDYPQRNVWIGRAPYQFSGKNYRLENGKLMVETRWEPDFPFSDKVDKPWGPNNNIISKFENVTTGCIIGRRDFQYGYMEIRSKSADAAVSSAFWLTGKGVELDIFEHFGSHRLPNKSHLERDLWWSIHDWSPQGKGVTTYTEHHDLGFRVADDFHVYGFEWSENGIRYYIDGKLFIEVSREKIDAYAKEKGLKQGYVITQPMHIWLDSEAFPWHGYATSKEDLERNSPTHKKHDGIVDFEIDYVRVWQKPIAVTQAINK